MPLSMQAPGMGNMNVDLSNSINKVFQPMLTSLMNNVMGGFFNTQQQKEKTSLQEKFVRSATDINEVIEPEDLVSDNGNSTVHSINLPGVRNKTDISVTKMENSIEIRAISGKRLYLKIIKREKGEGILSEQFTRENLVLVLKKI